MARDAYSPVARFFCVGSSHEPLPVLVGARDVAGNAGFPGLLHPLIHIEVQRAVDDAPRAWIDVDLGALGHAVGVVAAIGQRVTPGVG